MICLWLKSKLHCNSKCKCLRCKVVSFVKMVLLKVKNYLLREDTILNIDILKGLGLIFSSYLLYSTGNLLCALSFLLAGSGVLRLLDNWRRARLY